MKNIGYKLDFIIFLKEYNKIKYQTNHEIITKIRWETWGEIDDQIENLIKNQIKNL
jgi:hypothetical protein